MANPTRKRPADKPGKPRPDFPLYAHATGRWAKKVRGRLHYFGKIEDDPQGHAALEKWLAVKDDLLAGRRPRPQVDGLTVLQMSNAFLDFKRRRLESGEIGRRTYEDYREACLCLLSDLDPARAVLDLHPEDFDRIRAALAQRLGLVRLGNTITRIRAIFKWGLDQGLLERLPTFGQSFNRPSQKTMRRERAQKGPRMFTAEQLRAILEVGTPNVCAMMMLGINAGLGNTDVAELPIQAIDLKAGWLEYPRAKTGVHRRVPLWPETLAKLETALAHRPEPKDPAHATLLFIGARGQDYLGNRTGYRVHQAFKGALTKAKIKDRSFYDLRRTFQTIAEGARDLAAVQSIMGHAPPADDMSARYRQMVDDQRLKDAVEHVRAWLFKIPDDPQGIDTDTPDDEPRIIRFPSAG